MVSRIGGHQYKFSTGVKVYPAHWQPEIRRAVTAGRKLTDSDIENNLLVNKRVEEMAERFELFKARACCDSGLRRRFPENLRTFLTESGGEKRSKALLVNAFRSLYPKGCTSEGTLRTNTSRLKRILDFFNETGCDELSQKSLDRFCNYLNGHGIGVKHVNECCGLMKRLINTVLKMNEDAAEMAQVVYSPVKDRRRSHDAKKGCLLPDELEALRSVPLSGIEDSCRRLFLMQTECGVRASDLITVLESTPDHSDRCLTFVTRKEGIMATVILTGTIRSAIADFQAGRLPGIRFNAGFNLLYNRTLKRVARKAGLKRRIFWKEQRGQGLIARNAPLCNVISSHFARHTFITMRVREGWNAGILKLVTGHADESMIRRVYTHLSEADCQDIVMAEQIRLRQRITDMRTDLGTKHIPTGPG